MLLIAVLIAVGLLFLTVWLFILMDCVNGEFKGHQKLIWLLLISFLPVIGASGYLLIGRSRKTECHSPWNLIA